MITIRITAIVIGLLGLAMLWQGIDLAIVGGSIYFALAGLLLSISSVQLWRRLPSGFYIYGVALLVTLAWAVYEAGTSFWLVGSRIWIIGLISLWLCTPVIRRSIWRDDAPKLMSMRFVQACALASVAVLGAMIGNLMSTNVVEIPDQTYATSTNTSDWTAYAGSHAGTRYAPHEQINTENVDQLAVAWEAETDQPGRFSATPIQIDDAIYLCTSQNKVIALDADTGEERWRFDPENEVPGFGIFGNCRGVTYYHIPGRDKSEHCAERIYTATTDARMIALDRATGTACTEFGEGGQISLQAGMGEIKPFFYAVTSPPTLASGLLVTGGLVLDNQETEAPSGVVRAYDPITGDLAWAWDVGRDDVDTDSEAPEGGYYTRGTPNVWSIMSADDELGLVYLPTGNATPDYFGGHRTEIMEKYASSIVALDARTGETRWHYQTAHHDIWDLDVPSQPSLVDLEIDGQLRKALIAPTKRAEVFVLDRETGELIFDVEERAVPQGGLPHERYSPTQPFSTEMPSFAYDEITEHDLFGLSPFDQMACRKQFRELRWEGTLTPPTVGGTLLYPGPAGGMNWGSVAIDEERQLMVVNNTQLPFTIHMIPREEADKVSEGEGLNRGYGIGGPQRGTPFATRVVLFASPLGLPCLKPPFAEIAVVDLTTQQIIWRKGMGFWNLGFMHSAGSVATRGGLVFNAGAMTGEFRAYNSLTGEILFEETLRSGSDATPMSYVSSKTGKQYVVVTVPGDGRPRPSGGHSQETEDTAPPMGGKVIAYTLPE